MDTSRGVVLIWIFSYFVLCTCNNGLIQYESQYLGCYRDMTEQRALREHYVSFSNMTVEKCVSACSSNGNWKYAGLQYGGECRCGESGYRRYGEASSPLECDRTCTGNSQQNCGGELRNSVYRIRYYTYSYVGCFNDSRDARALTDFIVKNDRSMTAEKCALICFVNGKLLYAGAQYSQECWCGNSGYDQHGEVPAEQCNYPCAGNRTQICGGSNRNSVYRRDRFFKTTPAPSTVTSTVATTETSTTSTRTTTPTAYPTFSTSLSLANNTGFMNGTDDESLEFFREKKLKLLYITLAGSVSGVLLIVVITIISVCVKRRRKKNKKQEHFDEIGQDMHVHQKTTRSVSEASYLQPISTRPVMSDESYTSLELSKHGHTQDDHVYTDLDTNKHIYQVPVLNNQGATNGRNNSVASKNDERYASGLYEDILHYDNHYYNLPN